MPSWLVIVSWVCLVVNAACAVWIAVDLALGHRQNMWIMNLVWPITALYAGPLALALYFRYGRLSTRKRAMEAREHGEENPGKRKPFPAITAVAATHCGAGCTLGDILSECSILLFPAILTWLGYRTIWHERIFSAWVLDFILAFLLGVAFQYFTIVPMRHLPPGEGIWAALKADALSLTAWQLGMYGWMAIATFAIFHREIPKTSPVFWFMMQIAMLFGFVTSYPVNWWLVREGLKEKM